MHTTTDSPIYQKAFEQYLRKGTPIERSLKMMTARTETRDNHSTALYRWHTSGDDKVRPSHAANEGRIFNWDVAPPTGHPGDEPGCRCTAEPVNDLAETTGDSPSINLVNILRSYLASKAIWGNLELSLYFYIGGGQTVTLERIGQLGNIRALYELRYSRFFKDQILRNTSVFNSTTIRDSFENSYDFSNVLFSLRNSGISGRFAGSIVSSSTNSRVVRGVVNYTFNDSFKDPLSIAQLTVGIRNLIPFTPPISETELSSTLRTITNFGGTPYAITGAWSSRINIPIR